MATKINWEIDRLETLEVTGGCTKCSPGCANCWAIKNVWRMAGKKSLSKKWGGLVKKKNGKLNWTGKIKCFPEALSSPKLKGSGKTFFVNSKADLFHKDVNGAYLGDVFKVIRKTPQHTFMILTKRVERMKKVAEMLISGHGAEHFKHVEWGVTICNQEEADRILPIALQIPGFDFVSFEPLLSGIDASVCFDPARCPECGHTDSVDGFDVCGADDGNMFCNKCHAEIKPILLNPPKRFIIGCESGPDRRPIARKHIKDLYDQCKAAGVDVMVKQMAANEDGKGKVIKDPERCKEIIERN